MSDTAQASFSEEAADAADDVAPQGAEPLPPPRRTPFFDQTAPMLLVFLGVGLVVLVAAYLSVHTRASLLPTNGGASRTNVRITHWMNEGFFHYAGLLVHDRGGQLMIYTSSTGAEMVSSFLVQKIYRALFGRYSWTIGALHNQIVSLILSALLGLLAYRLTRRMGVDPRLAFAAGGSVVIVVFTFPDNLDLYWEVSAQAWALLFATVFLLLEERASDGNHTTKSLILQGGAAFMLACMERMFALAFFSAFAASIMLLEQRRGAWRRFLLVAVAPFVAVLALHSLQLTIVEKRFPNVEKVGSTIMKRSGMDGEALYYGDHLDIGRRRDIARHDWPANREYLFRWPSVFYLGALSALAVLAAYIAGRAPRIAVEALTWLTGGWLLYAAVFSQSFLIHPYLYDVLLFVPLALALFALIPALIESLTRRTGAIVMVALLCACWYALFQMRLYAMRYPMPGTNPGRLDFRVESR